MARQTKDAQQVDEVLRYCWGHTDNKQEEETLLWIAEHLATALKARYVFPDGKRQWTIDGTGKALITSAEPRRT
jgi:hypothetical protein